MQHLKERFIQCNFYGAFDLNLFEVPAWVCLGVYVCCVCGVFVLLQLREVQGAFNAEV